MIRYDAASGTYIAITNTISETSSTIDEEPDNLRNQLSLICSSDLRSWRVVKELLYHPDHKTHGFQYASWIFDGESIQYVCRTAADDKQGGAHSFHDANYLTFHAIKNFDRCSENIIMKKAPLRGRLYSLIMMFTRAWRIPSQHTPTSRERADPQPRLGRT